MIFTIHEKLHSKNMVWYFFDAMSHLRPILSTQQASQYDSSIYYVTLDVYQIRCACVEVLQTKQQIRQWPNYIHNN